MPVYSNNNSIKNQKNQVIKTRVGIALICVASILLLNLIINLLPFINSLMLGTFGLLTYAMLIGSIIVGIMLIKNVKISLQGSDILYLAFWFVTFITILHLATSIKFINGSFGEYISNCYKSKLTCGGVIFALITYPVNVISTHIVASFILLSIVLVILSAVTLVHFVTNRTTIKNKKPQLTKQEDFVEEDEVEEDFSKQQTYNETKSFDDDLIIPDEDVEIATSSSQIEIDNNEDKQKAKSILGLANQTSTVKNGKITNFAPSYDNKMEEFDKKYTVNSNKPQKFLHSETEISQKPERKLSEKDKENLKYLQDITGGYFGKSLKEDVPEITKTPEQSNQFVEDYDVMQDLYDEDLTQNNYKSKINQNAKNVLFNQQNNQTQTFKPEPKSFNTNQNNVNFNNVEEDDDDLDFNSFNNNFDDSVTIETEPVNFNRNQPRSYSSDTGYTSNRNNFNQSGSNKSNNNVQYKQEKMDLPKEPEKPKKKPYKKPPKYIKPPIDLLKSIPPSAIDESDDNAEKARVLEETLEMFNVPAKVVSITKGPAFTRFELQMKPGVPVKKVLSHSEDLAMILESNGEVRMEIPIPGKNAFGVEIPNRTIDTVPLRDILESYNFQGHKSPMAYALGKDITGDCKVAAIDNKSPHMLVAGQTGSGKSVCLNSMLISWIYKSSPEDLKIVLVDPKRVEFTLYNGLPHMLIPKAITDVDKAISALGWLADEMERRFAVFAEARVRNIQEFNNTNEVISGVEAKIPYIVFIIDELGDLMIENKKDVEEKIIKLTQKSRAAGIHLVVATQRPSVDVVTGRIKGNLPCRIAFAVASFPDSKTILDQSGAEKLLGRGDMLFKTSDLPSPHRIQGTYVSNEEVEAVVEYVKEHNEADFDEEIEDAMFNKKQGGFNAGGPNSFNEFDSLMKDALRLVITTGGVSTSKLQRAFGLGFPRAGKIVDQMEAAGFISAPDNKKIRTVYITQQEFEERFGEDL